MNKMGAKLLPFLMLIEAGRLTLDQLGQLIDIILHRSWIPVTTAFNIQT